MLNFKTITIINHERINNLQACLHSSCIKMPLRVFMLKFNAVRQRGNKRKSSRNSAYQYAIKTSSGVKIQECTFSWTQICNERPHDLIWLWNNYFTARFHGIQMFRIDGALLHHFLWHEGHCSQRVVKALRYKPAGSGFDSRWGEFLNLPNPSGRTRPLTEMSTRNIKIIMFLGSKVRPVRRANNLTAFCEPIV
jgi:hypothetical protein